MKRTEIYGVTNYYGGLNVMTLKGKYYWCVENYDTDFDDLSQWKEMPSSLYNEIIKHNNNPIE